MILRGVLHLSQPVIGQPSWRLVPRALWDQHFSLVHNGRDLLVAALAASAAGVPALRAYSRLSMPQKRPTGPWGGPESF
jgi:hypothetical protein